MRFPLRRTSLLDSRATVLLAVGSLALAACSDTSPTEPDALAPAAPAAFRAHTPAQARQFAGIDAEFVRIAREAPGFGGMFYEDGRLNVYVTLDADRSAVLDRVNASLSARGRALPAQVSVIPAGRDYARLAELRERMSPVLSETGVVFTDIDETRNQLRIGVREGANTGPIQAALRRLNVPLDAVSIETTEPIVPLATLRERNDPVAGGLQIWWFEPPSTAWICTLGFNVLVDGAPYFFTNSHCTEERAVVDGTEIRQDALVLPSRIVGVEVADPSYFRCQYAGYRCRWSDAALIQYLPGIDVELGMIYRTTSVSSGPGPVTIAPTGPGFMIIDDASFPLVGEVLDKVGRTTGWTRGPVVATCVDTGVADTRPRVVMLCQDFVQAGVAGGDSGSPVFAQNGMDRPVTLHGLLWGGGGNAFVFSALENIRAEFPAFRTH